MAQLGNPCPVRHASVAGISGIVAPMTDGTVYFFDWSAKECRPVEQCPGVVLGTLVAPQIVGEVLRQMRDARIVHVR